MFKNWFSGDRLSWYLQSSHKKHLDHLGASLLEQRYSPAVVRLHFHEWIRFAYYLEDHNLPIPSSFYAPEVHRYIDVRFPNGSPSRLRGIRAAIRIFLEIDDHGNFPRRLQGPRRPRNRLYAQAVPDHLDFLLKHRGVSKKTLSKRAFQLGVFTEYLSRIGVTSWNSVEAFVLRRFFTTQLNARKPPTRLSYASTLRNFHRWAYLTGFLQRDLSVAVTTVRQYRWAGIPDVLTEGELMAVLQSVARTTPIGKRDYAILLLAARYGLRPSDIRQLSLDHINWRDGWITLQQSKTHRPLVLPLLEDVAEALIEYLRFSRPETPFRNIFVRHQAPYEPFSPNNNLAAIFRGALHRAGLAQRRGRKGIYLLRHTLATRLLSSGNSIKTISDILGHKSMDSTLVYTKVDLSALGTVGLSIEEVLR